MNDRSSYRPERIQLAREMRGFTLEELGNMIGLSKGTISRYESGIVSGIRRNTINDLALALNVNPKWLLGESDDMEMQQHQRDIVIEFGDLEEATVEPKKSRSADPVDNLGDAVKAIAKDDALLRLVTEAAKLSDDDMKILLKIIESMSE